MTGVFQQAVLRRMAERRPASILHVGPPGDARFHDYLDAHPEARYVVLEPREALGRLPSLPRFALAFVAQALETLSKPEAERLVARLRDVHAEHLLLTVDLASQNGTRWEAGDFLALGLQRVETHGEVALYEFDIAHYKLTPDWLNSDHWAHPELFDKFRW